MKLKLVSDGTQEGTKVVDAETGELVEGVQSASYVYNLFGNPILSLELVGEIIDIHIKDKENGNSLDYRSTQKHECTVEDWDGNRLRDVQSISIEIGLDGISCKLGGIDQELNVNWNEESNDKFIMYEAYGNKTVEDVKGDYLYKKSAGKCVTPYKAKNMTTHQRLWNMLMERNKELCERK